MNRSQRENLERVIGSVEDARTTVEEIQEASPDDDGALEDVIKDLKRIEDDLDTIDADKS